MAVPNQGKYRAGDRRSADPSFATDDLVCRLLLENKQGRIDGGLHRQIARSKLIIIPLSEASPPTGGAFRRHHYPNHALIIQIAPWIRRNQPYLDMIGLFQRPGGAVRGWPAGSLQVSVTGLTLAILA
jgi:hypothetical protein